MRHTTRSLMVVLTLLGAALLHPGLSGRNASADDTAIPPRPKPVILDGVFFAAGTLPKSDTPRTFVVTADDQRKGVIRAFSSVESANAFMRRVIDRMRGPDGQISIAACQHPFNYSKFNTARGGGNPDNLFMDMDPNTFTPIQYQHLDFGGWNNTISWAAAACIGFPTAMYSCRWFEMQQTVECADPERLLVSPGVIYSDLVQQGFNNRTSSIKFGF